MILPAETLPATIESDQIRANLQRYAEAARGAKAAATVRAWKSDGAIFTGWCSQEGRQALPASPATVAVFVDAMAATRAPATVRRYVATIAALHRQARLENPCDGEDARLALERMHREKGRTQRQAAPLNRNRDPKKPEEPSLVERMLALPGETLIDLRNRALLATGYDTLGRRSELAELQLTDLKRDADGTGSIIIRRGKTDQEGRGKTRFIAPDTMRYLAAWLAAAGHTDGFLFRCVWKGSRVGGGLDGAEIARIFREMARAAGLSAKEAANVTGHSARVGGVQDMVETGIDLPAIMQSGGWQTSEMVARYSSRLAAKRSGAAKLAAIQKRI